MNIIEAMNERRSVRTFNGESISDSQKSALLTAIEDSFSPFGGNVSIRLKNFDLKAGYTPGTYGTIKGASDFFLVAFGNDDASALSAGFRFEQVVLQAWQLGLGSCWIAATFKGSDFERGELWRDGESLRIVCPVGIAAKPGIRERLTRLTFGSKNRKPFEKLFFYSDFTREVSPGNRFAEALEMMRLAPSSVNSQPWRALVIGDTVHFYYTPKSNLSLIDCGIGLCHFYEDERFHGHAGRFSKTDNPPAPPHGWKYLISYSAG
mgnify:FL=1